MKAKIQKINHTQISNDFLDKYMNKLSGNAVKVFCAIARKTIGWHRETDQISDTQLKKMTGLCINPIKRAKKELLDFEIIRINREGKGKSTKTFYEINYDNISKLDTLEENNVSTDDILDENNVSRNDILNDFNVSKNDISKSNISELDTLNQINVSKNDTLSPFNVSTDDSTKEINIKKEYKESVERVYQAYPTRDWKQKYSTGRCQKNRNQIKVLLKKYTESQIISEINKHVEERKKAGLSIKTFSRFLDEFPEPEKNIDDYDFENMSPDEVIKIGRL